MSKRIVIIGGVAAGASAAAKARRTSEEAEIIVIEAGPYMSFANCGLPYYVGGEIPSRDDLFVASPEMFAKRFGIDVRLRTVATAVHRDRKAVTVQKPDGSADEVPYDRLILATGTVGVVPPIEGLQRENVFTVRTVPDVDAITEHLARVGAPGHDAVAAEAASDSPVSAAVIGGGYIGLETAEQLRHRGLKVTVIEMQEQVMPGAVDAEMAWPLQQACQEAGIEVLTGQAVSRIEDRDGCSVAVTSAGREVPFDLGILSVGVRPNVELAAAAGLELGRTGAIAVDAFQRTSDEAIYAAGDNSETPHLVLGEAVNIPLAGPANKAGRAAGANAALDLAGAGDSDTHRLRLAGVLGTGVVRVCGQVAAMTGLSEKLARHHGIDYEVTYMPGSSHAGYYPGATRLLIKLLWSPADGKLLGAQCVGTDGVDKRIDVLATALVAGLAVEDLENLDLCYAPPFGSAKDPVIQAGSAAANTRRGIMPAITPAELFQRLAAGEEIDVIDVRTPREYQAGHLEMARNIPVDELRDRLAEVPESKPVALHCGVGYRSYVAQQILRHHGRGNALNVLGGYGLLRQVQAAGGDGKG